MKGSNDSDFGGWDGSTGPANSSWDYSAYDLPAGAWGYSPNSTSACSSGGSWGYSPDRSPDDAMEYIPHPSTNRSANPSWKYTPDHGWGYPEDPFDWQQKIAGESANDHVGDITGDEGRRGGSGGCSGKSAYHPPWTARKPYKGLIAALTSVAIAAAVAGVFLPAFIRANAPVMTPAATLPVAYTPVPADTAVPVTAAPAADPAETSDTSAYGIYQFYRGLLSSDGQNAYDKVAAAIAARRDSVTFDMRTPSELDAMMTYLARDRADFFWWNGGFIWSSYESNGITSFTVEPEYTKAADEIRALQATIDRECEDVVAGTRYASDYEKIKAAHDFIINRTIYDSAYYGTDISVTITEGRGVCENYTRLFQVIMGKMGIPSLYLNGGDHAWNLVCADGKWYQIDLTWDDPVRDDGTQTLNYIYFCITDEEMYRTHVCDYAEILPPCTATDANYYVMQNRLLQSFDTNTLRRWIDSDYQANRELSFRCANKWVFDEVYNAVSTQAYWNLVESTAAAAAPFTWSADDQYYTVTISW